MCRNTGHPVKLSDFDFDLPADLIAQTPMRPRDAARLLVAGPDAIEDHIVRDLPAYLRPGDRLIVNDTRVIPARLIGRRGEARAEATLIKDMGRGRWRAFARPGRRLRAGDRIDFGFDFSCTITGKLEDGEVELTFDRTGPALLEALHAAGAPPLPPYIKRPDGAVPEDATDYQTMFAERDGAVAAPTASLHFTPALMAAIVAQGVQTTRVTLHVGAGTFLPVKTNEIACHKMHSEWGEVSQNAVAEIEATRREGGRIIAVGTTPLRILEAASAGGRLAAFSGETDIFITPGYRFRTVDALMTNFHLPKSTLFMLVSALMGRERMHSVYAHAIRERYRFFSYGDSSLLLPKGPRP